MKEKRSDRIACQGHKNKATAKKQTTKNSEEILNKRPKGPHIVHLSTICHLFEESAKADIFDY